MDKSIEFFLLTSVEWQDAAGVFHETVRKNHRFGELSSVTASEFFAGGQNGLKPEFRIKMFEPDYNGENTIEYNGEIYTVYRTFLAKNDMIELYVEKRAGR